jgi:hypothetical protein
LRYGMPNRLIESPDGIIGGAVDGIGKLCDDAAVAGIQQSDFRVQA